MPCWHHAGTKADSLAARAGCSSLQLLFRRRRDQTQSTNPDQTQLSLLQGGALCLFWRRCLPRPAPHGEFKDSTPIIPHSSLHNAQSCHAACGPQQRMARRAGLLCKPVALEASRPAYMHTYICKPFSFHFSLCPYSCMSLSSPLDWQQDAVGCPAGTLACPRVAWTRGLVCCMPPLDSFNRWSAFPLATPAPFVRSSGRGEAHSSLGSTRASTPLMSIPHLSPPSPHHI